MRFKKGEYIHFAMTLVSSKLLRGHSNMRIIKVLKINFVVRNVVYFLINVNFSI